MSKILVAYFSATGTTAKAARAVADACRRIYLKSNLLKLIARLI